MTVTVKVLVQPLQLSSSAATLYAAPIGTRAIIDKATVTNTDTDNRTLSVNLVTSGGSPGASNIAIDERAIVPGETYLCPELIGQVLGPGDFVSALASASSALTVRISGREVT